MGRYAGGIELGPEALPILPRHRDGKVVMAAEYLGVAFETEAWEVEERKSVSVADVEEEVRRAGVVAVLEQLGQRELEEPLVEGNRPIDVGRDQGLMMHPAGSRRRTVPRRDQVLCAHLGPLVFPVGMVAVMSGSEMKPVACHRNILPQAALGWTSSHHTGRRGPTTRGKPRSPSPLGNRRHEWHHHHTEVTNDRWRHAEPRRVIGSYRESAKPISRTAPSLVRQLTTPRSTAR